MKFLFFIALSLAITFATAYWVKGFTYFLLINLLYAIVLGGVGRLKIPQAHVDNIFYFMACWIPIAFITSLMVGFNVINS